MVASDSRERLEASNDHVFSAPDSFHALYTHPLTYVLLGGIPSIYLVRSYFQLHYIVFWLGGFLLLSALSLYWLGRDGRLWPGLVMAGASGFGIYAVIHTVPSSMIRAELMNRRIHLVGEYQGSGRLVSEEINGDKLTTSLYFPQYELNSTDEGTARLNLSATATVRWPHNNPGFGNWLKREGYAGYLEVHRIHDRSRSPPPARSEFREQLADWFNGVAGRWPRSASFLSALVLGNQEALAEYDRTVFKRLGLVHLFVISGFHVGLVFVVVRFIFRWFGDWGLLVGGTASMLSYLWFLGWPPSATRAGLMVFIFLVARSLNRRTSRWSLLWTAVFLMLIVDPLMVTGVGFQLTVAAVIGIFCVMDYARWVDDYPLADYFVVSMGAFLGIMPVLLYHFHYVAALGSVFATVGVIVFPVFVGLLGLQWGLMAIDWRFFADLIERGFAWIMDGLGMLARSSGYLAVTDISLFTVCLLSVGLLLVVNPRRGLWLRGLGFGLVLVVLSGVIVSGVAPHTDVRLIEGKPVVISAGPNRPNTVVIPRHVRLESHQVEKLGRVLNRKGIRHVDRLVSDYTRSVFTRLGPTFTVGTYYVNWRRDDTVRWATVAFDFQDQTFRTPEINLEMSQPDSLGMSGYQPAIWVGYQPGSFCLLNHIERLSNEEYDRVKKRDCRMVLLGESPLVLSEGNQVSVPSVKTAVDQALLSPLVNQMTRFFRK